MREWLIDRELFLAEFLQFEGRGSYKHICHTCSMNDTSIFRCIDCDGASLYCSRCLLDSHSQNALHRIEVSISISQSQSGKLRYGLKRSGMQRDISPRQHSNNLDTVSNWDILLANRAVSLLHHSIRTSLLSILTGSTLFPLTSADVIHLRRTVFSCSALAGIPPRLDSLDQPRHTVF